MRNYPVHWCDGLFLTPHHFQAAERHFGELLASSSGLDHPYNYGIRRLELQDEEIPNSHFFIRRCQARTREGTLIDFATGNTPERVRLGTGEAPMVREEAMGMRLGSPEDGLKVYLALPRERSDAANVRVGSANGSSDELFRYREWRVEQEDANGGGNYREVSLKVPQPRLIATTDEDDLQNYEALPLAAINPLGQTGPELDQRYIPPLLAIDAWPSLQHDVLRYLYNRIGNKLDTYTEFVQANGLTWAVALTSGGEQLVWLDRLSMCYSSLHTLVHAQGVHPFFLYQELCRTVGSLAVFGAERRAPKDLPRYDHDNLGPIFTWLKDTIISLLESSGPQARYQVRKFRGSGLGMQVTLGSDWTDPGWEWYVGVDHPSISESRCHEVLEYDALHWKMASQGQVNMLFETMNPGLKLTPLGSRTPTVLPNKTGLSYYSVSREPKNVWNDVVQSKTLAMRFRDRSVENRNRLDGAEELILNLEKGNIGLQFTLFAVPPTV